MTHYEGTIQKIQLTTIFVRPQLVVLYTNPENAEPGNPTGATCGERFFVYGEDVDGDRLTHNKPYNTPEEAEELAERVREKLVINEKYWNHQPPAYGSKAWADEEPFTVAREREDARWD